MVCFAPKITNYNAARLYSMRSFLGVQALVWEHNENQAGGLHRVKYLSTTDCAKNTTNCSHLFELSQPNMQKNYLSHQKSEHIVFYLLQSMQLYYKFRSSIPKEIPFRPLTSSNIYICIMYLLSAVVPRYLLVNLNLIYQ
jgi:hypothetical protein